MMLSGSKIMSARFCRAKLMISPLAEKYAHDNDIDITQIRGSGDKGKILLWDIRSYLKPPQFRFRPDIASIHNTHRRGKLVNSLGEKSNNSEIRYVSDKRNPIKAENITSKSLLKTLAASPIKIEPSKQHLLSTRQNSKKESEKLLHQKMKIPHFYVNTECDFTMFYELLQLKNKDTLSLDEIVIKFVLKCLSKSLQEVGEFALFAHQGKFYKHSGFDLVSCDLSNNLVSQIARNKYSDKLNRSKTMIYFGGSSKINKITMPISEGSNFTLGVGSVEEKLSLGQEGKTIKKQISEFTYVFDHQVIDGAVGASLASKVKILIENPYKIF